MRGNPEAADRAVPRGNRAVGKRVPGDPRNKRRQLRTHAALCDFNSHGRGRVAKHRIDIMPLPSWGGPVSKGVRRDTAGPSRHEGRSRPGWVSGVGTME